MIFGYDKPLLIDVKEENAKGIHALINANKFNSFYNLKEQGLLKKIKNQLVAPKATRDTFAQVIDHFQKLRDKEENSSNSKAAKEKTPESKNDVPLMRSKEGINDLNPYHLVLSFAGIANDKQEAVADNILKDLRDKVVYEAPAPNA